VLRGTRGWRAKAWRYACAPAQRVQCVVFDLPSFATYYAGSVAVYGVMLPSRRRGAVTIVQATKSEEMASPDTRPRRYFRVR